MRLVHAFVALTIAIEVGYSQPPAPSILEGPVNAASYAQPALANGALAPGSMFIIKGANLGTCGTVIAQSFPLQPVMGNTQIRITAGGRTRLAYMIYVVACRNGNGPDQIAAILPSDTPLGDATVVVAMGGRTSTPVPFRVVSSSFGMFTRNQAGSGPAIVQNYISQASQPTNGLVESAQPGQLAILWGTGLGAALSDEAAGPVPGDLGTPIEVFVGGIKADINYRGRSGCCAGIDQIVFTIPRGVDGCYVSIAVRSGGIVSNVGTISVAPTGNVCAEPVGFSSRELSKLTDGGGLTVGTVFANRIKINLNLPGQGNIQGTVDDAGGAFNRYRTAADVMASNSIARALPSAGSCIISSFPFNGEDVFSAAFPDIPDFSNRTSVDAGPALTLTGPRGTKQISRSGDANTGYEYFMPEGTFIGGGVPLPGFPPLIPLYFDAGDFTLSNGTGSSAIGAFRTPLTIPATTLNWTNENALNTISRQQPLTINWTGGTANTLVSILGSSSNVTSKTGVLFYCAAKAESGTFTVPEWVLSALPASQPVSGIPVGFLQLESYPVRPSLITATGLDFGLFSASVVNLKNVKFE